MLEDLPVVPFREVYLSTFGFILHHWTVLFLCIILQCSSLRFQQAQDHQNRSSDEKVIAVFVLQFLSVFSQSDYPIQTESDYPTRISADRENVYFAAHRSMSDYPVQCRCSVPTLRKIARYLCIVQITGSNRLHTQSMM